MTLLKPDYINQALCFWGTLIKNKTSPLIHRQAYLIVFWVEIFLKKIYWSIVDLQCCVNFCCTAKWFSFMYIYYFSYSFPLWFITGYWVESPVLYSRFSFVTSFIRSINSVYVSIPVSQFIPPALSPLGIHTFALYLCVSISAFQY